MKSSDPTRTVAGRRWTSLRDVVDSVGPPVLQLAFGEDPERNRPIRATILHDPTEALPNVVDTLLLGCGVDIGVSEVTELVGQIATHGFSGLVVKRRGRRLEQVLAAAEAHSLSLLVAADDVPWLHLDSLILSVLGARASEGGPVAGSADDLFALANATAAVIGGSVAIEDLDRRVIAYSSIPGQRIDELRQQGILNRQVPSMQRHLRQYGAVLAARGVVRFTAREVGTPRAAVAIRAGNQPLGTIWAIEAEEGLTTSGEQALLDAGRLAALHVLRRHDATELGIQAREGILRAALEGRMSPEDLEFSIGLTHGLPILLIGFSVRRNAAAVVQLGSALARFFAIFHADAAITTTSHAAYVLVSGEGPEAAKRLAGGAAASLSPELRDEVTIGLSDVTRDPSEIPVLRRAVDDVLRAATARRGEGPVALSDVRPQVLLTRVGNVLDRAPELRHPGVAAMCAHDNAHRTDSARSVLAWLESAGDIGRAARVVGVHGNTLRYRLRRVEEKFAIDLSDPDTRLAVWLQLRCLAVPAHEALTSALPGEAAR